MEGSTIGYSLLAVLGGALLGCALLVLQWRRLTAWPGKRPPGPPRSGLAGNIGDLRHPGGPHLALQDLAATHGGVLGLQLGTWRCVVLSSEAAIAALRDQPIALAGRVTVPSAVILSRGGRDLVFSDYNEAWRVLRRLSHAAMFSRAKVEAQATLMGRHLGALVRTLREEGGGGSRAVKPRLLFKHAAMNTVSAILLGFEFDRESKEYLELASAVQGVFSNLGAANAADYLPWLRMLPKHRAPLAGMRAARERICGMLLKHVEQHKHTRDPSAPRDFLDHLLDRREKEAQRAKSKARQSSALKGGAGAEDALSDDRIVLLLMDLFLAGTDTTSTTLAWFVALLATHRDHQAAVHAELDAVCGTRQPQLKDIAYLPVLQRTIKETMRLRTVVPIIRRTTTQDCKICSYDVPANAIVLVNAWALHHDEGTWGPKPNSFNPDRWEGVTAEQEERRFVPFGGGTRMCTGWSLGLQQVQLGCALLAHAFRFEPPVEASIDLTPVYAQTLGPTDYSVRFVQRSPQPQPAVGAET